MSERIFICYVIRHKETGEYMPQLKGKGYSHWNPAVVNTISNLSRKLFGTPRLFPTRRSAMTSITQWASNPNAYNGYRKDAAPWDDDIIIKSKDDGRKKEDLEIVKVDINIGGGW